MKTIEITITGVSGLLQNRFPVEDQDKKEKKRTATSSDEKIEKLLHILPNGTIYEPSTHILAMLRAGGSKYKIKDHGKQTYKKVIGSGAVVIEPDCIPHLNQRWEIDSRPIVNKATGGRRLKKRPLFREWALSFKTIVEEEEVPVQTLREIFEYAGRRIGVGDYRPERGGPFGRFVVSRFEIKD